VPMWTGVSRGPDFCVDPSRVGSSLSWDKTGRL
jgi:hypothetical protein